MPDIHTLVANLLFPALLIFAGLVGYFFGIRPALRQNPAFKTLYDQEDTFLSALNAKLSGIKQRLTVIGLTVAGVAVTAHDQLAPLITQVGLDPSLILPKVPAWAWPVGSIAILWLIQRFREMADRAARANAEALLNAGHTLAAPAPGIPVTTLPSPSPLPDKTDS
jgi:hypothetical protein